MPVKPAATTETAADLNYTKLTMLHYPQPQKKNLRNRGCKQSTFSIKLILHKFQIDLLQIHSLTRVQRVLPMARPDHSISHMQIFLRSPVPG